MPLLRLPPEVRGIIFDFCFPPPKTSVQIIPYRISLPACRLNLPVALYRVCKLITSELPPLAVKLRRLDLTYIIQGRVLEAGFRPEYDRRPDDDYYKHFAFIMRFAERVRLVGTGPFRSIGGPMGAPSPVLIPGRECALKVLEVQPRTWSLQHLAGVVRERLSQLIRHPDVAARLEVRLIRETDDALGDDEQIKAVLREYQAGKERGTVRTHFYVDLTELDSSPDIKTDFREFEAWLKKIQDLKRT
ncbi:hypothetical protein MSAN_01916300 [Mycena sanguinolenta]|uniref:Uncharacterized protein n=1 Tax=Mycena sanguinolenta TaxID=230812 RepID=A0A8H7CR17_9AGAR|nr:hypothetical protein MSAN_01916300 [Mycena sanguinolenta]